MEGFSSFSTQYSRIVWLWSHDNVFIRWLCYCTVVTSLYFLSTLCTYIHTHIDSFITRTLTLCCLIEWGLFLHLVQPLTHKSQHILWLYHHSNKNKMVKWKYISTCIVMHFILFFHLYLELITEIVASGASRYKHCRLSQESCRILGYRVLVLNFGWFFHHSH